jgi:hypothetical protein
MQVYYFMARVDITRRQNKHMYTVTGRRNICWKEECSVKKEQGTKGTEERFKEKIHGARVTFCGKFYEHTIMWTTRAGNLNGRQQSSGILVGIHNALGAVGPFTKRRTECPCQIISLGHRLQEWYRSQSLSFFFSFLVSLPGLLLRV